MFRFNIISRTEFKVKSIKNKYSYFLNFGFPKNHHKHLCILWQTKCSTKSKNTMSWSYLYMNTDRTYQKCDRFEKCNGIFMFWNTGKILFLSMTLKHKHWFRSHLHSWLVWIDSFVNWYRNKIRKALCTTHFKGSKP